MPPLSAGSKGTGKKGGAGSMRQQQRSRNTTPISVAAATAAAAAAAASSAASATASSPAGSRASPASALPASQTFEPESVEGVKFDVMDRDLDYDDLVDATATGAALPDSKSLDSMITRLQTLGDVIERRGENSDRAMRLLAQSRKMRQDDLAEATISSRIDEDAAAAVAAAAAAATAAGGGGGGGGSMRKQNKKKRKAAPDSLAIGLGTNTERNSPMPDGGSSSKPPKASEENGSISSSLSPPAARTPNDMEVDNKGKAHAKSARAANNNSKDKKQKKGSAKAGSASEAGSESSSDQEKPKPRQRPQANTFGEDPSSFPDPTLYEILPVKPGMSEDEIKKIYSVSRYPKNDLSDRIAGDPPDKDYSSAKPSNQINFSTFSTYTDPYFRPFTEEDLGFLRERGDRVTPFVMPRRGKKHYTEVWAEEDGVSAMDVDSGAPPADIAPQNQPRGNIESMNDEVAEKGGVSTGPLLARLLAAMRPEHRPAPAETGDADRNGNNGIATYDFSFSDGGQSQQVNGPDGAANGGHGVEGEEQQKPLPPATQMPESESDAWRKASHPKLDYSQVDERIRQELRHIGFLPSGLDLSPGGAVPGGGGGIGGLASGSSGTGPGNVPPLSAGAGGPATANSGAAMLGGGGSASAAAGAAAGGSSAADGSAAAAAAAAGGNPAVADYDGHYDDEVAARLRLLQGRLREQVLLNGARKARLAELVKERMAHQEYQTILEDLDSQVNSSYLKRTRTMGKKPKKSRAPASAGGAAAGGGGAAAAGGGGAGAGGMLGTARPGIGDAARTLMDRRRRWIDNIGTVFEDVGPRGVRVPRAEEHPESSIFRPEVMAGLVLQEKVAWEEEVEEE